MKLYELMYNIKNNKEVPRRIKYRNKNYMLYTDINGNSDYYEYSDQSQLKDKLFDTYRLTVDRIDIEE